MVVLSIIPFSPVLGGIVAGYLHKRKGLKVGALAGLFAAILVAIVAIVIISILSFSMVTPGNVVVSPLVGFGLLSIVILVLVSLYTAGLGAFGGYLHDWNTTRA